MLLGAPRPGGWDRGRVGERLQAALAGLQELQVLREKQRELVRAALAMPQRPAVGGEQQPLSAHSKEHRLEVTLSALKEQLVRDRSGRDAPLPGSVSPAAVPSAGGRKRPMAVRYPAPLRHRGQAGRCSRGPCAVPPRRPRFLRGQGRAAGPGAAGARPATAAVAGGRYRGSGGARPERAALAAGAVPAGALRRSC